MLTTAHVRVVTSKLHEVTLATIDVRTDTAIERFEAF